MLLRLRAPLTCALLLLAAGPARAGGYGGAEWGEPLKSVQKKLHALKPQPRADLEPLQLEARVLRAERDARARQAAERKRSAAEVARLRRAAPARGRLAALTYWIDLGPLDGKVVLGFLDERLTQAEVNILFSPAERAAAAEILDLIEQKYGPSKEHRGEDGPGAPVVDVFESGDTRVEAYQQPAAGGHGGLVRLVYGNPDRASAVESYLDALHERWQQLEPARPSPGPTPEEREAARKAALMRHL